MYQKSYRNENYRQQEVMSARPLHLVVLAYDSAIRACELKDFSKATKTIGLLRDALDFDYPEVSLGLFRLYQWCLDCIRQNDYAEATKVLSSLREAWVTVEKRQMQAPTIVEPAAMAVSSAY
jgi:flagellin-specific chaperone FliS